MEKLFNVVHSAPSKVISYLLELFSPWERIWCSWLPQISFSHEVWRNRCVSLFFSPNFSSTHLHTHPSTSLVSICLDFTKDKRLICLFLNFIIDLIATQKITEFMWVLARASDPVWTQVNFLLSKRSTWAPLPNHLSKLSFIQLAKTLH